MQTINLKRIIAASGLKTTDLGKQLFPDVKNPYKSLLRVANGDGLLNSDQISKLSEILNVPIGLLYENADWNMSSAVQKGKRLIQFRTYDYFAELDLDTMVTTVARNGSVFFEKAIHKKGVGLNQYLSDLTDLIIKHK